MEATVELVKVVGRTFYEDKFSVLLDYLIRERMLPDDLLAERMQIMLKDVNKIASKLKEDRLIKCKVRQEERSYDGKPIQRTYFYIDYGSFADVVKYRLHGMRRLLEDKLKNEVNDKGYHCGHCKKTYSALDASRLINFKSQNFECESCGSELESVDASMLSGGSQVQSRLIEQINFVMKILKRVDEMAVPSFDVEEYLKRRDQLSLIGDGDEDDEGDLDCKSMRSLKVAGADGKGKGLQVELTTSSNTSSVKHEMPVWHTHSTITGAQVKQDAPVIGLIEQVQATRSDIDFEKYYSSIPTGAKRPRADTEKQLPNEVIDDVENVLMVSVAGVMKDITMVTDEDKDLMTSEEYQKYYEVFLQQNE